MGILLLLLLLLAVFGLRRESESNVGYSGSATMPAKGSAVGALTLRRQNRGAGLRIRLRGFTTSFKAPATSGRYNGAVAATIIRPGSTTSLTASILLVVR